MTNLTAKEKEALNEVFLCFQIEEKWYQRGLVGKILSLKLFRVVGEFLRRKLSKSKS